MEQENIQGETTENVEEQINEENPSESIIPFSSMFLFENNNRIRAHIHNLLNLKYFDLFLMIVICASSLALAAEDPIDEMSERNRILDYFDHFFTIVFTAEMLLKVLIF